MSLNLLLTLNRLVARTLLVFRLVPLGVHLKEVDPRVSDSTVEKISRNSNTRAHASVTNSSEPLISSPIEAA